MKRTGMAEEGSLELLLDTITNTFGSVLFIAILTALLVRLTPDAAQRTATLGSPKPQDTAAEAQRLESSIDELRKSLLAMPSPDAEISALQEMIDETFDEIIEALNTERSLAEETLRDQRRVLEIQQQAMEISKTLEEAQDKARYEAEKRQEMEEEATRLAQSALEIDRPLDPIQITQTAKLPVLNEVEKKQFGIVLKYGRVYVMHSWSGDGRRLGPNPNDFIVTREPDGTQVAQARPDAGFVVDAETVRDKLAQVLASHPPSDWVVAVVTATDSFSQFQSVKTALVSLGYQYDPIELRDDGIADSGGTARGQ